MSNNENGPHNEQEAPEVDPLAGDDVNGDGGARSGDDDDDETTTTQEVEINLDKTSRVVLAPKVIPSYMARSSTLTSNLTQNKVTKRKEEAPLGTPVRRPQVVVHPQTMGNCGLVTYERESGRGWNGGGGSAAKAIAEAALVEAAATAAAAAEEAETPEVRLHPAAAEGEKAGDWSGW